MRFLRKNVVFHIFLDYTIVTKKTVFFSSLFKTVEFDKNRVFSQFWCFAETGKVQVKFLFFEASIYVDFFSFYYVISFVPVLAQISLVIRLRTMTATASSSGGNYQDVDQKNHVFLNYLKCEISVEIMVFLTNFEEFEKISVF